MKKSAFFCFLLTFIFSCSKEGSERILNITTPDQNVSCKSHASLITFESPDSWTASANTDWIILNTTSGEAGSITIIAQIEENRSYDDRTGLVQIYSGRTSKAINICQKHFATILSSSNTIVIDENGGTPTVEIQSNIEYGCEIVGDAKSWISIEKTKSMTSNTLSLNVRPNSSRDSRQGDIALKSGDILENITVFQSGMASSSSSLEGTSWISPHNTNVGTTNSYTGVIAFLSNGIVAYSFNIIGSGSNSTNPTTYYPGVYGRSGSFYKIDLHSKVGSDSHTYTSYYGEVVGDFLILWRDSDRSFAPYFFQRTGTK